MAAPATEARSFDFEALRQALEHSDAEQLLALYADDAELSIVDRNCPPSTPMRLIGKSAIEGFWRDVCSRQMTHKIDHEVIGADRISFVERCRYPDGCQVMAAIVLDLKDRRIARQLTVQAWDDVGSTAEPTA